MRWRSDQFFFLFLIFFLSGCIASPEVIDDIRTLPQDNALYLTPSTANHEVITRQRQLEICEDFKHQFFLPWKMTAPSNTQADLCGEFSKYRSKPGYGENSRKRTGEWFEGLARNADLETYPNAGLKPSPLIPRTCVCCQPKSLTSQA